MLPHEEVVAVEGVRLEKRVEDREQPEPGPQGVSRVLDACALFAAPWPRTRGRPPKAGPQPPHDIGAEVIAVRGAMERRETKGESPTHLHP